MTQGQPQQEQDIRPLLDGQLEREIEHGIELAIAGRYEDLTEHALRVEQRLAKAAVSVKISPDSSPAARDALDGLVAQAQALEDVMAYAASVHRILHDVAKSSELGYGPPGTADKRVVPRGAHVHGEA